MRILLSLVLILELSACAEFSTPADLVAPQIIVVEADPPSVGLGERAALSIVVAGPEGRVTPATVTWQLAPGTLGILQDDGLGNWEYVAPADGDTSIAVVDVEVDVGATEPLRAKKSVGIGDSRANPTITEVLINGTAVTGIDPVSVPAATEVALDTRVSPASTDDSFVSWFSTVGEIEHYRQTPTTLLTPDTATSGMLFIVYRDGIGGVAWREVALTVE